MRNLKVLFLITAFAFMVFPAAAQALDFQDNFDSGINASWWNVSANGNSVVGANQQIEITQGTNNANTADLIFKYKIAGDFSATVDYALLNWPANNLERSGIRTSFGAVERISDVGFGGDVYLTHFLATGITSLGTADRSGSLKVERSGSTVTGSFYDTSLSNWHKIASSNEGPGDIDLMLSIWPAGTNSGGVKVAFDNFKLNAPNTTVTPEPVSLLLFGLGAGVLGLTKLRPKKK